MATSMKFRAPGFMVLGAVSLATMGAAIHFLGETVPWSLIVLVRCLVGLLVALTIAKATRVKLLIRGSLPLWARSFFGSIAMLSGYYAMTRIPPTDAMILLKTSPIWVGFLTALIEKRNHSRQVWIAIGFGVLGVGLLVQPEVRGHSDHWFPMVVAALSAFFTACGQTSIKFLKEIPTIAVVVHTSAVSFILILFVVLVTGGFGEVRSLDLASGQWLFLIAILGMVWQTSMTSAFRLGKTVLISLLGLLAIPVAAFYDYGFWDRTLGLLEISGISLIAASIYMISRTEQ
jgi:drug/metabolite transporter (DMT)-like permease